jgi:hypothetical protein
VPVLVIRLGCDGRLSIISAPRSAGGDAFDEDDEAIVQLYNEGKRRAERRNKKSKQARRRTKRGLAERPPEVVHATL